MFLWGYYFIVVHVPTIISVCSDAIWNVEDYRLKHVLEFVGKPGPYPHILYPGSPRNIEPLNMPILGKNCCGSLVTQRPGCNQQQ